MTDLAHYLADGADASSRAVLALLQGRLVGITESRNYGFNKRLEVNRWSNGREQGYITSLRVMPSNTKHPPQLNFAWFEHRNSDSICVLIWKQDSFNTLSIDTADFGDLYKDKYDVSASFKYNEQYNASEYIAKHIESYIELGLEGRHDEFEIEKK